MEAVEEAMDEQQDEGARDFLKGMFGGKTAQNTKAAASEKLDNAKTAVGNAYGRAKEKVTNAGRAVGDAVRTAGAAVKNGASTAGAAVANGVKSAGNAVANGYNTVKSNVQSAVNDGKNAALAGQIESQWQTFRTSLSKAGQDPNMGKFTQSAMNNIDKYVKNIIDGLRNSQAGFGYTEE